METFLDRVKKIKSEHNITNEMLADISGIPLSTLSKILAGMNDAPKLSTLIALANALDTTVGYLANGEEINDNNYYLDDEEIDIIDGYRSLDMHGRKMVEVVMQLERERIDRQRNSFEDEEPPKRIIQTVSNGKKTILLYDMSVSAGKGNYLDSDLADSIQIPDKPEIAKADYALKIAGNSMEPKYHEEDIILVQSTDKIEIGELGIFLLDGQAFFKKFGGDCLISLNPEYADIPLQNYGSVRCLGHVIGRLHRRNA